MSIHLIIFSPCGGTAKVVNALARDLPQPWQIHNITRPRDREQALTFGPDDLVFMGFPVYGGHMPRFFPDLIGHLNGEQTPLVMVAVYGNRAYEGAFLDMRPAVLARGFNPVAAVAGIAEHSVVPSLAAGRPDAADLDKLADYGRQAWQKALGRPDTLAAPGAYPSRGKLSPSAVVFTQTDPQVCTECGLCVGVCPNRAISIDEPSRTITEKCLVCVACIKYCPEKARQLGSSDTAKELAKILSAAEARKEAELFL